MYNNNVKILNTVTYHNLNILMHRFFLNPGLKYKKKYINKIIQVSYKYKSWVTFGLNGILASHVDEFEFEANWSIVLLFNNDHYKLHFLWLVRVLLDCNLSWLERKEYSIKELFFEGWKKLYSIEEMIINKVIGLS